MEHLNMNTVEGTQINLDALYQICPSCFTEVLDNQEGGVKRVVDFNKLRTLLGDNVEDSTPETYDFNWVGKRAAQRDAAASINKTLRPCPEESVDWDTTQNLYIEGDNLEVLKLLQNSYMGKVKMIYIDPPYNTGNDFVYHDDFAMSSEEYEDSIRDSYGNKYRKNTDSNGRFHSDWCSMIYSRLSVARTLLAEDGVIFVSIDDTEVGNLRKIGDEVFGQQNFIADLIWQKKFSRSNDATYFSTMHDHILCYCKNNILSNPNGWRIGLLPRGSEVPDGYANPDNDSRGLWTSVVLSAKSGSESLLYEIKTPSGRIVTPPSGRYWSCSKDTFESWVKDNRIWFGKDGNGIPRKKTFLSEVQDGLRPNTILLQSEAGNNQEGKQEVKALFDGVGVFDGPKPVRLLKMLIKIANLKDDDIVLDFFSGSATTAHALMESNIENSNRCHYILIQLPEAIDSSLEAGKAGFANICEIGKERIKRAGLKIKKENPDVKNLDTGFRVFKCDTSNMKDVYFSPTEYSQTQLTGLEDNIKEDRTDLDLLFDCMLRWGVELTQPVSSIKEANCTIHNVNDGDLVACFDGKITDVVIDKIADMNPLRVVFRDSNFDEASQKMNLFELFKQKCNWTEQEVINNVKVI